MPGATLIPKAISRAGLVNSEMGCSRAQRMSMTHKAKKLGHRRKLQKFARSLRMSATPLLVRHLAKLRWCYALYSQQIQALLTLFTKNFSTFPHGTCLLSVSTTCLLFDEDYHPLDAPIPKNATLQRCTEHKEFHPPGRTLTHDSACFHKTYNRTFDGYRLGTNTTWPTATIYLMIDSPVIRHY